MGTRGAYGFLVDGQEKIIYNHMDSYPSYLMDKFVEELSSFDDEAIRSVAKGLLPLPHETKSRAEWIAFFRSHPEFGDPGFFEKVIRSIPYNKYEFLGKEDRVEWYDLWQFCLEQSNFSAIELWFDRRIRGFWDSTSFLADSLFCEWAYIWNCDTKKFEVYRGFNKNPDAAGRYAKLKASYDTKYFGVALVTQIDVGDLRQNREAYIRQIEYLTEED